MVVQRRRRVENVRGHGQLTALVFQLVREQRLLLDRRLVPLGLTMQQAALLLRVAREGQARPNKVAADVGTDTAGITRLLDRLEAKRLIVREPDPADRRSLIIRLTDDGQELAPELGRIFAGVERDLTAAHSAADISRAQTIMTRLLENVRKASAASEDGAH
jgi:DNA-binding MarR family transcriptional regulator